MTSQDIGGIVTAFITGGGVAAYLTYKLKFRKLIGDYQVGEIGRANLRIDKLETDVEECQTERETLKAEVATLRVRLEALTGVVERSEAAKIVARIECDEKGVITGWNIAAVSMFYYTPAEALGSTIDLIVPQNKWDEHHAAFLKSVAGTGIVKPGVGERTIEVHAVTRDGEEIPVFVTLSSYKRDGKLRFIAKIKRR